MRHVVVGASAAGLAAAEAILSIDPAAHVTLLTEEPHPPYCRPLISYWLAQEIPEDRFPLPSPVLSRVELRTGVRAVALDPEGRRLELASGERLAYDRLCLATGAASKPLGLEGEGAPNVFGFRTRDDARGIAEEIDRGARRALVLGGGLVGVKAALALAARGVETRLCIASPHPLSQTVDEGAGALVAAALEEAGVRVAAGWKPQGLRVEGGRVTAVGFAPGPRWEPCDLVIRGKGVAPRVELFEALGAGSAQGVATDETLATPLPHVWAAGDAVLSFDLAWERPRLHAIWPAAVEQGTVAGRNMAGARESYPGSLAMNAVKIGDLFAVSVGIVRPPEGPYAVRTRREPARRLYRRVVTRQGRLVGAVFAGPDDGAAGVHQAGLLVSAVRAGRRADELPFDPLEDRIHWGRVACAAAVAPAPASAPPCP
ncbi:MAG: FAD-dependent oxidoreductase [Deferrisomatales bacterium]